MGDEEEMGFDPRQFFETLRKSASVKMGAIVFGEAQVAYYEVLKQHMSEEQAFNMLAHTTEHIIRGIASAAGPVCEAFFKGAVVWERFMADVPKSDKEVPGA
jgi:hypothetical protein